MKEHIHFNSNIFKKFLEKHDMVYEVPAEEWERGLPMGNAIVSSVIWGGNPIKVTLDRQDIWEIRSAFKPDKAKFKWKKFCEKFEQKNGGDVDDFYQVGGSNWKPQTEVDSGVCNHARMKWSPLHNHGETSLLEWVYEKTDDIYYEYLSLNRTV